IRAGVGGPWLSEGEVQGGSLMLLGDVVFLMHTDEKHREAAGLLAALRKHGRRTFTLDAPQHAALRAKLEQPVNVAFQELPLETAVAELAKLTQIDVRLDRPSLRAAGVRERSPVTLELADQTLETVLRGLLADLNLTWVLRDGALWIASRDDAARFHKAAVYDVRDLCRDENDSEALRQALMGQTRGPWDEGEQPQEADANAAPSKPGTIAFPRAGVMIVRHTESVHDDVLQLLENYRLALKASKPRQTPGVDPKEVIVRYYRLPATIAEALVPLLPTLTAPETWKAADRPEAPGAILHSLPSRSSLLAAKGHEVVGENAESSGAAAIVVNNVVIGIRQSREVHEQIADLLDRIESGDARHLPEYTTGYGMGGGMGGMGGGGMGGGGGFFSVPLKPAVVVPKR
ncbi:MAG TPA: hypothetical protein VGE52_17945, partial [Pirellulales bacterium]